jgi:processive 1,2-diacylglycerol beta-glucosyltransferase
MRGVLFYIEAGKGHYIPAKAIHDSMLKLGHESILQDLFLVIDTKFWHWFTKTVWRFMLHFPNYERRTSEKNDDPSIWRKYVSIAIFLYKKQFNRWLEKIKPEFILTTHFIGGILLPSLLRACGKAIPLYLYSADVFMCPRVGISNELDKLYIPSQFGVDWVIAHGQQRGRTALCSFPLQHKFTEFSMLTKEEARVKLKLGDKFTALLSLGGEGIGTTDFVEEVNRRGLDIQVLLVGNISKSTKVKYNIFMELHPYFDLHPIGYVQNINDYFLAADIVVGKQGANTLMESIYMHRPCLISEELYTARYSSEYLQSHGIGWSETEPSKQAQIVAECMQDTDFNVKMEKRFQAIPLKFGADDFARQIVQDTLEITKNHTRS